MIGFHGCDADLAYAVINGQASLRPSINKYDWLGHGIYFWERSPSRALQFATELQQNSKRAVRPIITPAVVGALLDLGKCLDLTDYEHLRHVQDSYLLFSKIVEHDGAVMPRNHTFNESNDLLLRELDCAVLEFFFLLNDLNGNEHYDSIRSPFIEGEELYPTAGFREKTHIQICIRDAGCIKAYFKPLNAEFIQMYSMS